MHELLLDRDLYAGIFGALDPKSLATLRTVSRDCNRLGNTPAVVGAVVARAVREDAQDLATWLLVELGRHLDLFSRGAGLQAFESVWQQHRAALVPCLLELAAREGDVTAVFWVLCAEEHAPFEKNVIEAAANAAIAAGQTAVCLMLLLEATAGGHTVAMERLLAAADPSLVLDHLLGIASGSGHTEAMKLLFAKDGRGLSAYTCSMALRAAAASGRTVAMELLFERVPGLVFPIYCSAALNAAAKGGQREAMELLFAKAPELDAADCVQALISAAASGRKEAMELLFARAPGLLDAADCGQALISAARSGHKEAMELLFARAPGLLNAADCGQALISAARSGHKDAMELLFARAPELVNASAAASGHNEAMELLYANAPLLNADCGNLPYCLVALSAAWNSGHKDVMELLLTKAPEALQGLGNDVLALQPPAKGCAQRTDIRVVADVERYAIAEAIRRQDASVFERLLQVERIAAGPLLLEAALKDNDISLLKRLLAVPRIVERADTNILRNAVSGQKLDVIECLLGVPRIVEIDGGEALGRAVFLARDDGSRQVLKRLLQDERMVQTGGCMALTWAVLVNNTAALELLIQDERIVQAGGMVALELAAHNHNTATIECLRKVVKDGP
ncbi:hypothetical protein HYH03_015062 [Edaphochlamys debaryana]|uniref:Uncharacterized protein n=1 Tax=Edaphochlamys debaryana TaxID=47281 RepID=A0A836BRL1_9CHLO|nr:hypothetical protein HYH03_015062 [Edaphochlamys debaryana]|eukprot:KAG2486237.1 hypothetical protein HYH03_015062 [Edaphochlamys debaryana]